MSDNEQTAVQRLEKKSSSDSDTKAPGPDSRAPAAVVPGDSAPNSSQAPQMAPVPALPGVAPSNNPYPQQPYPQQPYPQQPYPQQPYPQQPYPQQPYVAQPYPTPYGAPHQQPPMQPGVVMAVPMPTYITTTTGPGGATTVTTTAAVFQMQLPNRWPEGPVQLVCPSCHTNIATQVSSKPGLSAWAGVGILCLLGCWMGCCFIPLCVEPLQDKEHTCPQCHRHLGTRQPFF